MIWELLRDLVTSVSAGAAVAFVVFALAPVRPDEDAAKFDAGSGVVAGVATALFVLMVVA